MKVAQNGLKHDLVLEFLKSAENFEIIEFFISSHKQTINQPYQRNIQTSTTVSRSAL